MKFKYIKKKDLTLLPKTSGVYSFKGKKVLYIGKAGNIKERVKNHFLQPTQKDSLFVFKTKTIGYIETNSEIEALLLESRLIKEIQPKYNTIWKDDKNYFYISIKDEVVSITHYPNKIGPFVDGNALKKTLRILRKVFPYLTTKNHINGLCTFCHLRLCPGKNPNKKNINNLIAVLKGKKQFVLRGLKKEMKIASRKKDYEKAAELRDKIFAFERIIENSKIFEEKDINTEKIDNTIKEIIGKRVKRIEGYDISNIQGKDATGSMVVFINSKPEKSCYRKFKIRLQEPNDTAMIKELLKRRLSHKEWQYPDLILIDGGKPQLSTALSIIKDIPIISLAKKNNELFIKGKKTPLLLKNLNNDFSNLILRIRDEAHRFAITYHKNLREKKLN